MRRNRNPWLCWTAGLCTAGFAWAPQSWAQGWSGDQADGLMLNFSDASLRTVLEYLSEEVGLVIVFNEEIDTRLSIVSRQPMSLDEAIDLINAALFMDGYTAVRRERLLRVVALEDARVESVPVRYGNDPARMGNSDTVVTQIIPIRYAAVEELAGDIANLIDTEYAVFAPNESSNSLILTDTEANVRRIAEIIRAVDQSISSVRDVRVFRLSYADASSTASLIESIFDQGPSEEDLIGRAVQRRFGGGGGRRGGGGGEEGGGEGEGVQASGVTARADNRTNSVVVSAAPELMPNIESVIMELDSDTTSRESVFVYEVKNLQATDLAEVMNQLLSDAGNTSEGQRNNRNNRNNNENGGNEGPTPVASLSGADSVSLVGQVRIVANEESNSLMILTAERNFERVEEILMELDQPLPQVLIRVLIVEVTLDDSLDVGVEWQALDLSGTLQSLGTDFDVAAASGGLVGTLLDAGDFTATIRLLQETGKLDVLSRPYILASDNQQAEINIGQEVPFITNSRQIDEGNTLNTIEYRDIGILLDVTPQVNSAQQVTLDISQTLSALTGTTVPISENLDAVVVANREANTRVVVGDGQTIVIGGLMQDQFTETQEKVPVLGDIPWVGYLFRRTQTTKNKTELLIFLTPEIITSPEELTPMSEQIRMDSSAENAVAPGMLQNHLDRMGSHDGQALQEHLDRLMQQQGQAQPTPTPSEEPAP